MADNCNIIYDDAGNVDMVLADNGQPSKLFWAIQSLPFIDGEQKALDYYAFAKGVTGENLLTDENGEPVLVFMPLSTEGVRSPSQFSSTGITTYENFEEALKADNNQNGVRYGFIRGEVVRVSEYDPNVSQAELMARHSEKIEEYSDPWSDVAHILTLENARNKQHVIFGETLFTEAGKLKRGGQSKTFEGFVEGLLTRGVLDFERNSVRPEKTPYNPVLFNEKGEKHVTKQEIVELDKLVNMNHPIYKQLYQSFARKGGGWVHMFGGRTSEGLALFHRGTENIALNVNHPDFKKLQDQNYLERVIAHEIIHFEINDALKKRQSLRDAFDSELNDLRDYMLSKLPKVIPAELKRKIGYIRSGSPEEMITYALTDPVVTQFFDSILMPGSRTKLDTIWMRIKKLIMGVFKSTQSTLLDEVTDVLNQYVGDFRTNSLFYKPNPEVAQVAKNYMKKIGLPEAPIDFVSKLDKDNSKRIAQAYEDAVHRPNDPEVQRAYQQMAEETIAQYQAMIDAGYTVEIFEGQGEPYANSKELIDDLMYNKHSFILSTRKEYGDDTSNVEEQEARNYAQEALDLIAQARTLIAENNREQLAELMRQHSVRGLEVRKTITNKVDNAHYNLFDRAWQTSLSWSRLDSRDDQRLTEMMDTWEEGINKSQGRIEDTPIETNLISEEQMAENPLLQESGFTDVNGESLLINDLFRAIHDFFGHAEIGNGFGATGEENAWMIHSRMFSPLARRAMTTETRGQNSWVNFSGINDEAQKMLAESRRLKKEGKEAEAEDMKAQALSGFRFADQKITLLPEWVSQTNVEGQANDQTSFERLVDETKAYKESNYREERFFPLSDEESKLVQSYGKRITQGENLLERFTQAEHGGIREGGSLHAEVTVGLDRLHKAITGFTRQADRGNRRDTLRAEQEYLTEYLTKVGKYWPNVNMKLGMHSNTGAESMIWYDAERGVVTKAISTAHHNDWKGFMDRVTIHNTVFPATRLKLIAGGIVTTPNAGNQFNLVFEQPAIIAKDGANRGQTEQYMNMLGFHDHGDYGAPKYVNEDYVINDLHGDNVLVTPEGNLAVIDNLIAFNVPEFGYGGTRVLQENRYEEDQQADVYQINNEHSRLVFSETPTGVQIERIDTMMYYSGMDSARKLVEDFVNRVNNHNMTITLNLPVENQRLGKFFESAGFVFKEERFFDAIFGEKKRQPLVQMVRMPVNPQPNTTNEKQEVINRMVNNGDISRSCKL